ncbi:hypothetical protein CRG98_016641 [Punica granatum]|uniref:Uncharacterized protein n=1 Tax=Punica granatum TaxID=22663 RepID=A0A2I0K377_PUNGR|nr:hypothetical protein CRG98_016641 [Punica granatum]
MAAFGFFVFSGYPGKDSPSYSPSLPPQKLNSNLQLPYLDAICYQPPTKIRFSRWNNANAERFNEYRCSQYEIEDDIRRERCFNSATKMAQIDDPDTAQPSSDATFKSTSNSSSPSSPSIPSRKSKYSQPHPAFKKISKVQKTQIAGSTDTDDQALVNRTANVALTDDRGYRSLATAEIETLAARTLTRRRIKSRRSSNVLRTSCISIPFPFAEEPLDDEDEDSHLEIAWGLI